MTGTPPTEASVRAMRLFCESVYQCTGRTLAAVLEFDWSGYPRVDAVIRGLPVPVTEDALAKAAAELLREAAEDLRPNFPSRDSHITPLEAFELHVLGSRPWPSVQALLEEQGRPHSRGTLIRRQHQLLPFLLEWASAELAVDGARRGLGRRVRFGVVLGLLGVVLIGAFVWRSSSVGVVQAGPGVVELREDLRGRMVPREAYRTGLLAAPYPPFRVAPVNAERMVLLALESSPGRSLLLHGHQATGDPAAQFGLWDPVGMEFVWESSFLPPPRERLTHAGVGSEVLSHSYRSVMVFHGGPEGDLGDVAAFVLHQKYSPTFVVFVTVSTGDVYGYYVHPGQFTGGLVVDLDQDGSCELLLGGQDNSLDRPALVVLEPRAGRMAASTVAWNSGARESAVRRAFLPAWPEAQGLIGSQRLAVYEMDRHAFDYSSRVLTVGVGSNGKILYHARFGADLRPLEEVPVVIWDRDRSTLAEVGIGEPDVGVWLGGVEVVEGDGLR